MNSDVIIIGAGPGGYETAGKQGEPASTKAVFLQNAFAVAPK